MGVLVGGGYRRRNSLCSGTVAGNNNFIFVIFVAFVFAVLQEVWTKSRNLASFLVRTLLGVAILSCFIFGSSFPVESKN